MAVVAVIHDSPTPTASDTALRDFLVARGHTVDLVVESPTTAVSSATYAAVVISESGSSTSVDPYVTWPNGVLVFETPWSTLLLTSETASGGSQGNNVDLTGTHEINTGFADPLQIFDTFQNVWGVTVASLASGAEAIALQPGDTTRAVAIVADAGATATSGTFAGKRAAMGLIADRPAALNSTGQDYVTAIVDWLVGGSTSQGSATGSHTWTGTALGSNAPATPTGLLATAVSASQIDLSWDAVTAASGYDIERDGVVIVTDHAITTYSDTGLSASTEYTYRVRAVD